MTQLTPNEEDPVVHGLLANLTQFSPSPDFADRVMSHVWRPAPSWVQRVTHVCSTALNSKNIWKVVGGLAATSAVAMIAIAVTAITHWVHVETAWSVMLAMAVDLWRLSVGFTTELTVLGIRWAQPVTTNPTLLATVAASSAMILGLSGLGLQRTISQYRNERALLHARQ